MKEDQVQAPLAAGRGLWLIAGECAQCGQRTEQPAHACPHDRPCGVVVLDCSSCLVAHGLEFESPREVLDGGQSERHVIKARRSP